MAVVEIASAPRKAKTNATEDSKPRTKPPRAGSASYGKRVDQLLEGAKIDPETRARLEAMPMKKVWKEYHKTWDVTLRNFLVEKFLPLVRYNAERVHTRLPAEVDIDDLMSAGLFGLFHAIDDFDLAREVKFETYSATRIRGAILDELRHLDWVPRLVRIRQGVVERTRAKLEMKMGRQPTPEEIAESIDGDTEKVAKVMRDGGNAVGVTSLARICYQTDGSREVREIDVINDNSQINPALEAQRRDLKELLSKGLTRAERLIVTLYYYEEMTMKEIGAVLDLSESRVSQMHSSILARLKAHMQHREREFEPEE